MVRVRRFLVALACATLTVAVASSAALGGTRYFFCEMMGVVLRDPCRTNAPVEHDVALNEPHTDCCQVGELKRAPSGALHAALRVAPSPVVAFAPVEHGRVDARPARRSITRANLRGPPTTSLRVHETVMVFLT